MSLSLASNSLELEKACLGGLAWLEALILRRSVLHISSLMPQSCVRAISFTTIGDSSYCLVLCILRCVNGMGSSRTGLELENTSRTSFGSLGLGL